MPFIEEKACDSCGSPMLGEVEDGDLCNECYELKRPWRQGRAALLYASKARTLVLRIKKGDRSDLAITAGKWMARSARDIVTNDHIVTPVPLHWTRLFKRRYNQAEVLSYHVAKELGLQHQPDILIRQKSTRILEGLNFQDRTKTLENVMKVRPRRLKSIHKKPILLIDDVMTSGASLSACTQALLMAGASDVSILVLARATSH